MSSRIEPYKNIALIYDQVRPGYPEQLIQDIIRKTNIGADSTLLEIGAGTGKATIQLAEKGFKIHAILDRKLLFYINSLRYFCSFLSMTILYFSDIKTKLICKII